MFKILNVNECTERLLLVLLILLTITMYAYNSTTNENTLLIKRNIIGKVKSVETMTYGVKINNLYYENTGLEDFFKEKEFFNRDGNIERTLIYDQSNNLKVEYLNLYEDGRLVGEQMKSNGASIDTYTFIKYSDDLLTETKRELTEDALERFKSITIYNEEGEKLSNEFYFAGELSRNYEYKYNELNQMVSKYCISHNSNEEYTSYYEYDDEGNLILELRKNADDFMSYKIKKEYDTNNNLIKEVKSINEYVEYIMTYEYEYDRNKNWISKTTRKDDEITKKESRIIKFYHF